MRVRVIGLIAWSSSVWTERLVLAGLACSVFAMGLGTAWDIHWHSAVGRDAFWIPPHVLVYAGAAMAGVLAVAMPALTIVQGDVRSAVARLKTQFSMGYGPVGLGTVTIGIAAGFDSIWHRTVGDRTIWSPPHALGVIGAITVTLGTTYALLYAGRRGVLAESTARTFAMLLMATIFAAAHFALLAPALMVSSAGAAGLSYFFVKTPYLAAGLAGVVLCAPVMCVRRLFGSQGVALVAIAAAGMWGAQELFHLVATPIVAGLSGYVVKSNAYPTTLFSLVVLGSVLLPLLAVNRLRGDRPSVIGALMAGLYAAEVMLWTGMLWEGSRPAWFPIPAVVVIGSLSATLGDRIGQSMSAVSLDPD